MALRRTTLVIAFAAAAVNAAAQPTLRERALASDAEAITLPFIRHTSPITIDDLSRTADLVVEGHLRFVRSYLSEDERYIYTDFEVVPIAVIKDGESASAKRPTPSEPTVVTVFGGEVFIEHKRVSVIDTDAVPIPKTAARFLMFLQRTPGARRRYELRGSAAGLFEVQEDGSVRSMIRDYKNEELRGKRIDDIVTRIRSIR